MDADLPEPPEPEVCQTCGRPLVRWGEQGACVHCLVQFAVDPEEDEAPPLGTNLRRGHFEIATEADGSPVELGHGAMGTTYRAQDTILHRAVALKVIDGSVAEHPAARSRFLREARAAAQLQHPNVATVSHYGEQDGQCYYAMELVEGETLEARVRRHGPLDPAAALEIAAQVARALAAAEAQGIVHRDLKPSNIMLVGGTDVAAAPVVKVIDFGLAKAVAAGAEIPGPGDTRGGFVGTPAYASPEQFSRGEDERIDTRSDIYSLGVTLWYLLCGKVPFVGQTLTEIHEQQTRQPLPLGQLKAVPVPGPLVVLLRAMLAVAPSSRPQSARELLELCDRCRAQLSVSRQTARRQAIRLAAVGAALLLAAVLGWFAWTRRQTAPAANPSVAILPFKNLNADAGDVYFAHGVHDTLAAGLSRISQLRVISGESIKPYPASKPRDLPAIGRTLAVAHLVEGSVKRDQSRMQVDLRVADLADPKKDWSAHYDRPIAEQFALLSEMTRAVAERVHADASAAELTNINRRPTADPVAYDLYLRAKEGPLVFPNEVKMREEAHREIALLDQAVARDPSFVPALCALAKAHGDIASRTQGRTPEEIAVDHRALAQAALEAARRIQPDSGEVHVAYAAYYSGVTHDFERARTEAELARRDLPNSVRLESIVGHVAMHQGRWEDALRSIRRLVSLDPRNLASHGQLEETCQFLRRYDEADHELVVMMSLLPPSAVATLPSARATLALEGQADLAPLRASVAELTDAQDPDRDLRDSYGVILAVYGNDEKRLRYVIAQSKIATYEYAGYACPKAWFEGLAARMRHDDAAAQTAFAAARPDVAKTVSANPRDERNLLLLAMIDAALGHKEDSIREGERACAMPPLEAERLTGPSDRCCLAIVYAWTGEFERAFGLLSTLVEGPAGAGIPNQPTYGDLKLSPMWDPLRADPRFAALTQRLAPIQIKAATAQFAPASP